MNILRMIYFSTNQESTRKTKTDLKAANSTSKEDRSEQTTELKMRDFFVQ